MHPLLTSLLVAGVCYSAVDARPGSRGRPQHAAAGGPNVDVEEELMSCMISVQMSCLPIIAEVFPEGLPDTAAAVETLTELGIKDVCSIVLRLEQCAMTALNTQCSDMARQTIFMMGGQQITAARNALQYTCVSHIEDFAELETCVKRKAQQGVNIEAAVGARCPDVDATVNGHAICGIRNQLTCPINVLESYCGKQGTDALEGLISGLFRDLGCDAFSGRNRIDRAVKLLRRAFK